MSTTAVRQHPTRVTPLAAMPGASTTAREFPVRFNLTSGPLALLRRPRQSFGWVGAGSVLLESRGVRVNAWRLTLLGLRRTSRLIEAAAIREVYREGAAIQIDLQAEGRRSTCRFWAADAQAAADIVRLLPTSRTIELDSAAPPAAARPDRDLRWSSLGIFLALVLLVVIAWLGATRLPLSSSGGASPQQVQARHSELPLQSAQVVQHVARAQAQVGRLEARQDLQKLTRRFDALTAEFSVAFDALQMGTLSQQEFANGLERWLLPQWDALGAELPPSSPSQDNSARADADALLRGAVDSWHRALPAYAHGLRNNDHNEVLKAFGYIADAEGYERESRDMLERLSTP